MEMQAMPQLGLSKKEIYRNMLVDLRERGWDMASAKEMVRCMIQTEKMKSTMERASLASSVATTPRAVSIAMEVPLPPPAYELTDSHCSGSSVVSTCTNSSAQSTPHMRAAVATRSPSPPAVWEAGHEDAPVAPRCSASHSLPGTPMLDYFTLDVSKTF